MTDVSTRELKANLSRYLREVENGGEVTVTRRGKRIAKISRTENETAVDPAMARLLATGAVHWSGKKFTLPKKRIKLAGKGPSIAEIVHEMRR